MSLREKAQALKEAARIGMEKFENHHAKGCLAATKSAIEKKRKLHCALFGASGARSGRFRTASEVGGGAELPWSFVSPRLDGVSCMSGFLSFSPSFRFMISLLCGRSFVARKGSKAK